MFRSARPIWLAQDYQPDEYMQAVGTLTLSTLPQRAVLRIAADSDYTLFIGGTLAAFGPRSIP